MNPSKSFYNLDYLGLICVSGHDAKKLLQGQLTCNLDEIPLKNNLLGAHCTPQGRIISLFRLFEYANEYYLQMPRELIPLALAALKKYAVFFKVTLRDASQELLCLGYCGTQLEKIPSDCFIMTLSNRYEVIGKPAQIAELLKNNPHPLSTSAEWQKLDITAGIPAIYPETSEKFLPHELNLQNLDAISFNKGCYTGQEIIARMHYRGKLKTHLYRAKISTSSLPKRGEEIIIADQSCGYLVDFVEIGYNNYELLMISSAVEIDSLPLEILRLN